MKLKIGQRVRLPSTGEVGIVSWISWSEAIAEDDVYVTFFGTEWPTGAPQRLPYVLRYAASTLEAVQE